MLRDVKPLGVHVTTLQIFIRNSATMGTGQFHVQGDQQDSGNGHPI